MSARLLRAAVWSGHTGLHRATAVVSDDPGLEDTLVGAYSRFVLVGADGIRLHEEILYAGGWLPEAGGFRRLENLTVLGGLLDRALTVGTPASPVVQHRLAAHGKCAALPYASFTHHDVSPSPATLAAGSIIGEDASDCAR